MPDDQGLAGWKERLSVFRLVQTFAPPYNCSEKEKGSTIVLTLNDSGLKYLSTDLFA
jgi:hypothetical protein